MERFIDIRGRKHYRVSCYRVDVSAEMKSKALEFAMKIVEGKNQYIRLLPSEVKSSPDVPYAVKLEIQRTYVGKLGEMAFAELLEAKNKTFDTGYMFEIFEGKENVDAFDFITKNRETVDIKTGFLSNHKRLLINEEQFSGIPKDYYVGVKLNCPREDLKTRLIELDSIVSAEILGYVERVFLRNLPPRHFGEGMARNIFYNQLMAIDKLIEKF